MLTCKFLAPKVCREFATQDMYASEYTGTGLVGKKWRGFRTDLVDMELVRSIRRNSIAI